MVLGDITNRPLASPSSNRKGKGKKKAALASPSSAGSVRPVASPNQHLFTSPQFLFSPAVPAPLLHTGITPALAKLSLESPSPKAIEHGSTRTPAPIFASLQTQPPEWIQKAVRNGGLVLAATLTLSAVYLLVAPSPSLPPSPPPLARTAEDLIGIQNRALFTTEARLEAVSKSLEIVPPQVTVNKVATSSAPAVQVTAAAFEEVLEEAFEEAFEEIISHESAIDSVAVDNKPGEELQPSAVANVVLPEAAPAPVHVVVAEPVLTPTEEDADVVANRAAWQALRLSTEIEVQRLRIKVEAASLGWPAYLGAPRHAQLPRSEAKCTGLPPPWANETLLGEVAAAALAGELAADYGTSPVPEAPERTVSMDVATPLLTSRAIAHPTIPLHELTAASKPAPLPVASTFFMLITPPSPPPVALATWDHMAFAHHIAHSMPADASTSLVVRPSGAAIAVALLPTDKTTFTSVAAFFTSRALSLVARNAKVRTPSPVLRSFGYLRFDEPHVQEPRSSATSETDVAACRALVVYNPIQWSLATPPSSLARLPELAAQAKDTAATVDVDTRTAGISSTITSILPTSDTANEATLDAYTRAADMSAAFASMLPTGENVAAFTSTLSTIASPQLIVPGTTLAPAAVSRAEYLDETTLPDAHALKVMLNRTGALCADLVDTVTAGSESLHQVLGKLADHEYKAFASGPEGSLGSLLETILGPRADSSAHVPVSPMPSSVWMYMAAAMLLSAIALVTDRPNTSASVERMADSKPAHADAASFTSPEAQAVFPLVEVQTVSSPEVAASVSAAAQDDARLELESAVSDGLGGMGSPMDVLHGINPIVLFEFGSNGDKLFPSIHAKKVATPPIRRSRRLRGDKE